MSDSRYTNERDIGRRWAEAELDYTDAVDPDNFVDIREFAMVEVLVPEAANGLAMTPLFADDDEGTGKAIPTYFSGGAYAAFPAETVSTGDRVVLQAETAAGHFLGLRFGSAITGTVTLRLKG